MAGRHGRRVAAVMLRRRLDRLEGQRGKSEMIADITVLHPMVTPSAAGPVVVGAMLRRAGEPWRHLTREPGEALGAFMARAEGAR